MSTVSRGELEMDDVLCMSLLIQKVHFKSDTHALKQSLYNSATKAQQSAN